MPRRSGHVEAELISDIADGRTWRLQSHAVACIKLYRGSLTQLSGSSASLTAHCERKW